MIYATTGYSFFGDKPEKRISAENINNAELLRLAYSVLGYIEEGDYKALSRIAHPKFGVVFSPHATVALTTNQCFRTDQIASLETDQKVYVWGVQAGTGEPIEMTPVRYVTEYILTKDYANASIVGINRIVRSGNALENIKDEFPDVKFVDFHVPGGEKDTTEDFDWTSLRLGFEEYEGKLWLAVILNSKWTA